MCSIPLQIDGRWRGLRGVEGGGATISSLGGHGKEAPGGATGTGAAIDYFFPHEWLCVISGKGG